MATALKVGQILGVLAFAAAVALAISGKVGSGAMFMVGALLYGGCRLAA